MYWRSFDKCLISITCYAPSHMLQKQGVTAARQKSPGDPVPSVLSSGCPLEVTSHFWKFRAFCWKLQLHFCDYMKKGVGFQIFFLLEFHQNLPGSWTNTFVRSLIPFPMAGCIVGGGQSLPEVTSLLDFLDMKDYWVVTTSATPKAFCVAGATSAQVLEIHFSKGS